MGSSLKKILCTVKFDLFRQIGLTMFGAVAGAIILRVAIVQESSVFYISTFMAWVISIMTSLLFGAVSLPQTFDQAVGMGMTRRLFISCYLIGALAVNTILLLLVEMVYHAEKWFITTKLAHLPVEAGVDIWMESWLLVPFVLLLSVLRMLFGTLTLKLGNKVFLVSYIAAAALVLLFRHLPEVYPKATEKLLTSVMRFTELNWCMLLLAAAIIVYGVIFGMLRRQQVK